MFYQVGNQVFLNKFLAAEHAVKNNQAVHFNMYESAFDRCDWSRDPDLSWNELLDIRAHQIAAKNKPIVLNFSGGTDSYTIYKVFERNNIHIDVLYMRVWKDDRENSRAKQVYELLDQGLYDPSIKIITDQDSVEKYRKCYSSPYWIFEKGIRYHWGFRSGDTPTEQYLSEVLGTTDFISVLGLEKPRLKFEGNMVYSYQDDENYGRIMPNPTLDCFYISPDLPELHVKQSYMLLKYIRSMNPTAASPSDLVGFNAIHDPSCFDWLDYSVKGCGRFDDLNQSHLQHLGNIRQKIIIPTLGETVCYSGRNTDWWNILKDDIAQKNYLEGLMMVAQSDAGRLLLMTPDNFYSINQFRSKKYAMTF
jgi:hypothetical protein